MYLFGLVLDTGRSDDTVFATVAEDAAIAIEKCVADYETTYGVKFPYKNEDWYVEYQVDLNGVVHFHRSFD